MIYSLIPWGGNVAKNEVLRLMGRPFPPYFGQKVLLSIVDVWN
jgi:hypothetical protein